MMLSLLSLIKFLLQANLQDPPAHKKNYSNFDKFRQIADLEDKMLVEKSVLTSPSSSPMESPPA